MSRQGKVTTLLPRPAGGYGDMDSNEPTLDGGDGATSEGEEAQCPVHERLGRRASPSHHMEALDVSCMGGSTEEASAPIFSSEDDLQLTCKPPSPDRAGPCLGVAVTTPIVLSYDVLKSPVKIVYSRRPATQCTSAALTLETQEGAIDFGVVDAHVLPVALVDDATQLRGLSSSSLGPTSMELVDLPVAIGKDRFIQSIACWSNKLLSMPLLSKRKQNHRKLIKYPPCRSRWIMGAGVEFSSDVLSTRSKRKALRSLELIGENEGLHDQALQEYARLFAKPLSDSHVTALATLFGWHLPTDDSWMAEDGGVMAH